MAKGTHHYCYIPKEDDNIDKIEWCCVSLEESQYIDYAYEFTDEGESKTKAVGLKLYDHTTTEYISYCPFCGAPIITEVN